MSKVKTCSKCQREFRCHDDESGCWCNGLKLSTEKLEFLGTHFKNCLCKDCLSEIESKNLDELELGQR